MTSDTLQLFFINLDRDRDRARYMWSCLQEFGLEAQTQRFPAVDATCETMRNGFRRSFASRCYALNPTEIAIFETHRAVWQTIVDLEVEQAVILEDDLVFGPGVKDTLVDLAAHASDYDVIKLDGIRLPQRLGAAQTVGELSLRSLHNVSYSSAAYMVSREGAQRLLREFETYNTQLDLEIFAPRSGWRMLQLYPAIAVQGMFLSEADRARVPQFILSSSRKRDPRHRRRGELEPWWFSVKRNIQTRVFKRYPWQLWRRRLFLRSGGTIERVPLRDGFAQYNKVP